MNKKTVANEFKKKTPLYITIIILAAYPILHGGEQFWEILVIGTLGLTLKVLTKDDNVSKTFNYSKLSLVIYLLYLLIYIINGETGLITIMKTASLERSYESVISKTIALTLPFVIISGIKNKAEVIIHVKAMVVISTVICIYGWINYITEGKYSYITPQLPFSTDWKQWINGTFSYKNHFGLFLITMMTLNIGLIRHEHTKYTNIYYSMLIILAATFTQINSRGSLIIMVIAILLYAIFDNKFFNLSIKKITLVIITFFIALSLSTSAQRFIQSGFDSNGRIESYRNAISIFMDNIIDGTGPGTYEVVRFYYQTFESSNTIMLKWVHNDYLETLANEGIIGFFLFMNIIYWALKKSKNTSGIGINLKVCAIIILIYATFDYTFSLPYYLSIILYYLFLSQYEKN